jgi:hypothetical protein
LIIQATVENGHRKEIAKFYINWATVGIAARGAKHNFLLFLTPKSARKTHFSVMSGTICLQMPPLPTDPVMFLNNSIGILIHPIVKASKCYRDQLSENKINNISTV